MLLRIAQACSPVVQCIRTCIDMYDANNDEALQNLYLRPNLPECDPASSFYVDVVLANMLIEEEMGGLVPSSAPTFNQEIGFVAMTKFSDKFRGDAEFQERLLRRVERVRMVLIYFNVGYDPDDHEEEQQEEARIVCTAVAERCDFLKRAMPHGGPSLRDALVLFWYMIMNTTKNLEAKMQAVEEFTKTACPTGARRKLDVKKSVFTKLLTLGTSRVICVTRC